MNIGQVLETHLGWVAQVLGFKVLTPVFDGADDIAIEDGLARAWLAQRSGAVELEPGKIHTPMNLEVAKKWVDSRGYSSDKVFNEKHHGQATDICQVRRQRHCRSERVEAAGIGRRDSKT
jgi:DNA-directed RNA polymerase subunit beta